MSRVLILACCAFFVWGSLVSTVMAASCKDPGSSARFCAADRDKNDSLSPEEFSSAFPDISVQAFTVLDRNSDGSVDLDEWDTFLSTHHSTGDMGGAKTPEPEAKPLIMPPSGSGK